MDQETKKAAQNKKEDITRRQALQKMGYAAFASSTMLLLLNNPTMAQSTSGDPGDPGGGGGPFDKINNDSQQKSNDPWANDNDPWK